MTNSDLIYLDYNATTPVAEEAIEAAERALRAAWGNPSSMHAYGREAKRVLEEARCCVAALIGAQPDEIVFTSGGTESDNAAIIGMAEALSAKGRHLVISSVEHAAVEEPCRLLESRGFSVTRCGVDRNGRVSADEFAENLRPDTILVSLIHAQNETGVLQPVTEVARLAREKGIAIHTDAAQSVGKLPVRVDDLGVDALTLAGHKLYAPKGVGALYLRRGTPFAPFLRGAGHESGRRSGTESVAMAAALGAACALAEREFGTRPGHLIAQRDRLEAGLRGRFSRLAIHGDAAARLPNTSSVAFPGIRAQDLLAHLHGVAAAGGPACHAGAVTPSRVLLAMGVPEELALSTLRLTVGRPTHPGEIDAAVDRIAVAADYCLRA